ncbi:MAG: tyrosine-type recombinase/integrase [Candidatus Izemoplasmatales bacterium]|nr:tyrosine-type recombinase/integrase [Candidatus Izemoplasmatales bacterium]
MTKTHPLENLITSYLYEKDITKGTSALYEIILKQYLNYLKNHQILYATSQNVKDYLSDIKDKGYSPSWIYNQMVILKGFYQYLSFNQVRLDLEEIYALNITETLKNVHVEKKIKKPILTIKQAKHLILYLKNNRKYSWHYRDYALVFLMITTGLRSIEVRRAKIKDLDVIHGKHILYIQGKGRDSADEFVKISSGLYEAITDYLKIRKDHNPYLFVSKSKSSKKPLDRTAFNGLMKRILRDSGLSDTNITAHSLRHTAATINLKRGGTLEETKRLLRHQEMSNTLIYTQDMDEKLNDTVSNLENYILGDENHQNE